MTDKEKLEKIKKLADAMYYNAHSLATDASGLRKAMAEYHKFRVNEYREEEPNTSVWHNKSERPFFDKRKNSLNMIAVAGVTKFFKGKESMSVGHLLSNGRIYSPLTENDYDFEECPFTKWAYIDDLLKL